MAGDFNGTGANTSIVSATNQPGFGTGPSTFVACVLPDSAGQSGVGRICISNTSAGVARRVFSVNSAGKLTFSVTRATTNTNFVASDRGLVFPAASDSKAAAVVAATFDDAASPKVALYSSSTGSFNGAQVLECAYGTSAAGSGTVTTDGLGSAKYTIGNANGVTSAWDGAMLWVCMVPAVLTLNQIQALAMGVHPALVFGDIADSRAVSFQATGDGSPVDILGTGVTWSATAIGFRDDAVSAAQGLWLPA